MSLLFTILPLNITNSLADEKSVSEALDAAMDPVVASAPNNQAIMAKLWNPVVDKIKTTIDDKLSDATDEVHDKVEAAVRELVGDLQNNVFMAGRLYPLHDVNKAGPDRVFVLQHLVLSLVVTTENHDRAVPVARRNDAVDACEVGVA